MSFEGWLYLMGLVIQAIIFAKIFQKSGYTGWLGVLMVMPLVNLLTLLWFAAADWPLEMGYVGQGDDPRVDAAWELKMALRRSKALEKRGNLAGAIKQLELIAEKAGEGHPNALMAQERVRQLKSRASTDRPN